MKKILILGLLLSTHQSFAGTANSELSWYGAIPALLAIVMAIVSKQVILSLLIGLVSGSFLESISSNSKSFFFGLDKVFDNYILGAIADNGHASVILFSLLIAGAISIMTKMGAFNGLVRWLGKYAKSKKSALLITYFMGFFVFFDDYANTLVVGNTMRKITDKFKISREKLAFIVDATAAPIASIAFVSTWIGYEIQLINDGLGDVRHPGMESGYSVFLNAIGYSFYPIVILVFILVLILTEKDFGSMRRFELAQKECLAVDQSEDKIIKPIWAIIPIIILLFVTIFGIYLTGRVDNGIVSAIQTGNCYTGLIWGSASCFGSVFFISLFVNNSVSINIDWMFDGMKELFPALCVLILAWSLNSVLEDLKLGEFLGGLILKNEISFSIIPVLTFILSALIAFSTGSSFSTMGILIPIVISVCLTYYPSLGFELGVFYASIASVLSGAVLGDHCSPISDTTVLSSMATGCNHINHVKSQLPYCLIAGLIAVVLSILNCVFYLNLPLTYLIGVGLIWLIIRCLGKSSS